jgi:8-oxo-dGTP pyrophosphatase MutT (NUDIX family)
LSVRPAITVAAIIERNARFLVVEERDAGRLVINQPAGHVEPGETILEAAVRETLEETGWSFAPTALLGTYLWHNPATDALTLRFAFVGDVTAHHPERTLDADIVQATWLSRSELAARSAQLRSPLVLQCVDDYLSGRRAPLETVVCIAPPGGRG